MKYLNSKNFLFASGMVLAMPGIEYFGVSLSYLPCFFSLIYLPSAFTKIPRSIVLLLSCSFIVFCSEVFFPTSTNYLNSRYRSSTNLINTKFATSNFSENLILWLKFSLAVLGGILIVHFAFTKMHEVMLVRGFLFGSLLSVVVGLLTLEQGDGFFLQSSGLGRTTTTFGMICSFSISLTFFTEIRLKFQTQVILIFAMTVGTLISGSRGAALTACAALLLILAWNGRESRVFLLTWLLCVSVLGLYLYGFQLLERIGVRAFTANRSTFQSNVIREQLRQQAILDWQYDPIAGVGFSVITQGHSTYLQTLAAGGLILFVTYLILDLKSFSIALECISHRNHVYRLGIVFCIIFNHFTQNQIDVPFLYLILGIVYYAKRVDVSRTFTQGRSGYV